MAYFIEIKIVSDKLNDIRELLDSYIKLGFDNNGLIQSDNGTYFTFVNKDFGLIKK